MVARGIPKCRVQVNVAEAPDPTLCARQCKGFHLALPDPKQQSSDLDLEVLRCLDCGEPLGSGHAPDLVGCGTHGFIEESGFCGGWAPFV